MKTKLQSSPRSKDFLTSDAPELKKSKESGDKAASCVRPDAPFPVLAFYKASMLSHRTLVDARLFTVRVFLFLSAPMNGSSAPAFIHVTSFGA